MQTSILSTEQQETDSRRLLQVLLKQWRVVDKTKKVVFVITTTLLATRDAWENLPTNAPHAFLGRVRGGGGGGGPTWTHTTHPPLFHKARGEEHAAGLDYISFLGFGDSALHRTSGKENSDCRCEQPLKLGNQTTLLRR